MTDRLTLKQIAKHFGVKPKTFARRVRADNIPYLPLGRSMTFDLVEVKAYLKSRIPKNNVVQLKPPVLKSRQTRSRFAEEVGI